MASASNTAVFLVFHREWKGKPDHLYSYNEEEATHVLAATNITRELLKDNKSRQALEKIAEDFIREHPGNWYDKKSAHEVADKFVELVLGNFPSLFCDDGFRNPNVTSCHFRRKYDESFTNQQAICLNGLRVRAMCTAAKKAEASNSPDSMEHRQYRLFVFMFAITIFHELGHMFMTFLALGEKDTPDDFRPDLSGINAPEGAEMGNVFEGYVFGGSVVYGLDDALDDDQSGVPHLVNKEDINRISQQEVDEFLKFNFRIPFDTDEPAISDPLEALGKDIDPSEIRDPLDWPQMRALAEKHTSHPFDFDDDLKSLESSISARKKIHVSPQSALARVIFQPKLRIEVVK